MKRFRVLNRFGIGWHIFVCLALVTGRGAVAEPSIVPDGTKISEAKPNGRDAYLTMIRRESEHVGLPSEITDAVVQVESAYNPAAVGSVGEIGLMQIRPETAAMLGYTGGTAGLFDPETNVRFGVMYLKRAWQLAGHDLCRALMKYRAGHGEERMTPLSVRYCQRARQHLASIRSLLGVAAASEKDPDSAESVAAVGTGPTIVAAKRIIHPGAEEVFSKELTLARAQARSRRGLRTDQDSRRFWAAHEARIKLIKERQRSAQLRFHKRI